MSFGIAPGGRVGLIGESGSGKSLTALSLMGLLPDGLRATGRSGWAGATWSARRKRRLEGLRGREVSMVFQEPHDRPQPADARRRAGGRGHDAARQVTREARTRAVELLDRVRPPAPGTARPRLPHQLSGGQRQRVMLAIALANEPGLLIADEPTTALDVTVQAQMLELHRRLVAEHGPRCCSSPTTSAVVAAVCERVLVMYGGRIVESGPIREVFTRPRHRYTEGLLAASKLRRAAPGCPPSRAPSRPPGASPPAACSATAARTPPSGARPSRP